MAGSLGLIILGNTGVGKSFIANVLLDRDDFEHRTSATAVTHETEKRTMVVADRSFSVFNIPGLLEDDEAAIERNKKEIHKAFALEPNSIIMFVFTGGAGGRLRNEDLAAFRAIHEAYQFQPDSLLLIVNDLPEDRDSAYESTCIEHFRKLLSLKDPHALFLNRIDKKDPKQREHMRMQLFDEVSRRSAQIHTKKQEIVMNIERAKEAIQKAKEEQDRFQRELASMHGHIQKQQAEFDEYRRNAERRISEAQKSGGNPFLAILSAIFHPIASALGTAIGSRLMK